MKNNLNYDLYKYYNKETKMFQCFICKKSFSRPSSLAIHRNIHSGEKPYECDQCKKKFNVLSNLRRHKKIHESTTNDELKKKNSLNTIKNKINDKQHNTDRQYHKLKPLSMSSYAPSNEPITPVNNGYFVDMQTNAMANPNMVPTMMVPPPTYIPDPNHMMSYYYMYNQQPPYQCMPMQQVNRSQQSLSSTTETLTNDDEKNMNNEKEESKTKKSVLSVSEMLNSSSNDSSISSE